MPRVTADTNIYISALNFGGQPARLLRLAESGAIQLIVSGAILDEMASVLRDEKFSWDNDKISQARQEILNMAERVEPTHRLERISADPSDNRILECADAGHADFIVSGDKHLLALGQHGQAPILKVRDFLRLLQAEIEREA